MGNVEVYATGIGTAVIIIGAVAAMVRDTRGQITRMYHRFDEHKQHMNDNFVSDKICKIINTQMNDDIKEIKKDVKELLKKANGG